MNKEVILSASKIKTAQTCSWRYWTNYELKLPQSSNDGASRGWICHLIFEILGDKKHKKHYNSIIKNGSISLSPAIERLVHYHAKKLNVYDSENLELIDIMIVKGLLYDFFGKHSTNPTKAISEQEFNMQIDDAGKSYRIRGFIDKLFLYKKTKKALIRDFKTSKQLFKGKEITDNLQNLMYCLAVKKLYPEYENIEVEFLFLKFDLERDLLDQPGKGVIKMEKISQEELEGFEYQLSSLQEYFENFTEEDARSNFAALQDYPSDKTFGGPLACGKNGFKKSRGEYVTNSEGEKIPNFICEHRNPMDYYAISDEKGRLIKTSKEKPDKDSLKKGYTISKKHYKGCPHFFEKSGFLV